MATGRQMQLTKQVGEYLVCSELCRRGFMSTTFAGNVPDFDIVAVDRKHNAHPIQVKALNRGNWQFYADKFLDIKFESDGSQKVVGMKVYDTSDLIFVFVRLATLGKDEFFILRRSDLQELMFANYKEYLKKHGGKRPKSAESTHTTVSPQMLSQYRDNWDLITQ